MTGVPPPPPSSGAAGAAGGSLIALGPATVVEAPDAVRTAGRELLLSGTATAPTTDGTVRVRTAMGEVVLKTEALVPPNRLVVLQIGRTLDAALFLEPGSLPRPRRPAEPMPAPARRAPGVPPMPAGQETPPAIPKASGGLAPRLSTLAPGATFTTPGGTAAPRGETTGVGVQKPSLSAGTLLAAMADPTTPGSDPADASRQPASRPAVAPSTAAPLPQTSMTKPADTSQILSPQPQGAGRSSPQPAAPGTPATTAATGTTVVPSEDIAAEPIAVPSTATRTTATLVHTRPPPAAEAPRLPPSKPPPVSQDAPRDATPATSVVSVVRPVPAAPSAGPPVSSPDRHVPLQRETAPDSTAVPSTPMRTGLPDARPISPPVSPPVSAAPTQRMHQDPPTGPLEPPVGDAEPLPTSRALPPGMPSQLATPVAPPVRHAPDVAVEEELPDMREWPALRDLIDTVRALDPALGRALLDAVAPQPTPRLSGSILLLMAALRLGDVRPLIGERAARAIDLAGRRDMAKRVLDEFAGPSPRDPSSPADWRSFAFPFPDNGHLARASFHWRREPEPEDGSDAPERMSTRFLIDLELSRLGPMQVDGHYRAARIDITLRSHRPLASDLRDRMRESVHAALKRVGLAGGLSFQAGTGGWLTLERA